MNRIRKRDIKAVRLHILLNALIVTRLRACFIEEQAPVSQVRNGRYYSSGPLFLVRFLPIKYMLPCNP